MLLLLLLLMATVSGENFDQGTQTSKSTSVGEAFKLTKVDVDGYVSGGKHLYSALSDSCFLDEDTPRYKKNYHVFSDREDLVDEFAVSLGLTSGEEMKKSPSATYLSESHIGKSGYLMEVLFIGRTRTLSADCLNEHPLHPTLLHDLRSLPYPVRNPHLRSSWRSYKAFLDKWGTHLLKTTQYGVKVVLHSTKTTTENKAGLTAHFCGKMTEKSIDIPICASETPSLHATMGYSSSGENDAEVESVHVYGGRLESRVRLQQNKGALDGELITRLSQEALTHEAPVKNTWQSVPHILNTRLMFRGEEGLKLRSIALHDYYKGFHLFGCSHDLINGHNVTVFVNQGTDRNPIFKCMQARPGCQTDGDCHTSPLPYLSPCYCAGRGCVGLIKSRATAKMSRQFANRRTHEGSYGDTTNRRCYWSGGACKCEPRALEEVWPLKGSPLLPTNLSLSDNSWLCYFLFFLVVLLVGALGLMVKLNWRRENIVPYVRSLRQNSKDRQRESKRVEPKSL